MSERLIRVFPDVPALQEAAAEYVHSVLAPSAQGHDVRIALSGGSTPRRMHELLAAMPGTDWNKIHIYFGDERTVGPDDAQSNYRMARETLLDLTPIPAANVHRMRGEDEPLAAATDYETELSQSFGIASGEIPRFDLVILGMGGDGHTASLFPSTEALSESRRLVVANEVPQLNTTRITLTYPVLNNAASVLFLAAGADKSSAAAKVLGDRAPDLPPAAGVRPTNGELRWFLDAAAAADLPPQ